MKISLITVCYNSAAVIRTALESVAAQKGVEVEHIVVDGGSTDGTVEVLGDFECESTEGDSCQRPAAGAPQVRLRWLSEKDDGMYDAMNKGIRLATGDVIGLLNADDVLADDGVLARVAAAFEDDPTLDGTYADIRFVRSPEDDSPDLRLRLQTSTPTVRYCSGRRFRPWMFRFGTQVAHPSSFFRRSCFDRWGDYSLDYGMYGDFELLLRFIWKHRAKMRYLPFCTTVMRMGGASTNGWRTTVKINQADRRALRDNGCWSCYPFLYARYLFKIWGFLLRPSH